MPDEAEAAGFEAFCRAAHPRLTVALSHIVGDHAVGEELAQEALIRAYLRWPRVSQLDSPLGWTVHVGTNLARSTLRRRAVERRAPRREAPPAAAGDAATVVAVRDALGRLRIEDREVVVLRWYVGLTSDEIGALLGVGGSAVRHRTRRALDALRPLLADGAEPVADGVDAAAGDLEVLDDA